jgi:hypothetical protein
VQQKKNNLMSGQTKNDDFDNDDRYQLEIEKIGR